MSLCRRLDDSGPQGKIYCCKVMNEHAYWTIDCEVPSLKLTNHKDVIKLHDVFDRRKLTHSDKSVSFVYELCEGNSLNKILESRKDKGMKDLPKGIYLKWALSMARAVQYLNQKHYILHSDLHAANWFLRSTGEIVSGDFGCSFVLGKDGFRPAGCNQHLYEGHSAPEAQVEGGKQSTDFSWPNDVWQLAFCYRVMMNSGEWF